MPAPLSVLFVASECAQFVKSGGLGDVVAALPIALRALGVDARIVLPRYDAISLEGLVRHDAPLGVPLGRGEAWAGVLETRMPGSDVPVYLLDHRELFGRGYLYDPPGGSAGDNLIRYGFLCRGALQLCLHLGFTPDVFHVHDWQAAMVAVMLRSVYFFDPVFRHVPAVLTVHNAGYQGWFPPRTMETLLLPWEMFTFDKLEHYDTVDFLKGGVVYADAITTVSHTYAEEIQTPEFGNGLEDTFRKRRGDLFGILNGVDYDEWDPATDPHIAAHYSAKNLAGKKECRRDLLHAFGFEGVGENTAVIGVVSRFATQKGIDFIVDIMDRLLQQDIVLVMLGNGEEYYERLLQEMAARHPEKVRVQVKFDNVMAHKIEAGSDIFLMPSRYEPGGLNQIYSLKYGTVPVVRATGGLEDTIDEQPNGGGNGFKFWGYSPDDLMAALQRALGTFRNKQEWTAMMQRGMSQDFSWDKPAAEYVRVYERVIQNRS